MAYDFKAYKAKLAETGEWLKGELVGIQTGRANPAVFDSVLVESYGAKVPLKQVASITAEDARTIRIAPWDTDQITNIQKAITDADLGVSVSADDKGVRASFPELTSDRREQMVKLIGKKLEAARTSVRRERDEVWEDIQTKEQDGEISEDEKFRFKEEMEKMTKEMNQALEDLAEAKGKDIKE